MAVSQREVYILPHPISLKPEEKHPFIVLSILEANNNENTFIGVMITGSEITKDDYSFELKDEMFIKPLKKDNCHVRMHLITLCLTEEVIGQKVNEMKDFYFKELMASIGDLIFNYDFKPKLSS
jgi:hypothetical protein